MPRERSKASRRGAGRPSGNIAGRQPGLSRAACATTFSSVPRDAANSAAFRTRSGRWTWITFCRGLRVERTIPTICRRYTGEPRRIDFYGPGGRHVGSADPNHGVTVTEAEIHDMDVVQAEGGWLAKIRAVQSGPMPTRRGDLIVRHVNQRYGICSRYTKSGSPAVFSVHRPPSI